MITCVMYTIKRSASHTAQGPHLGAVLCGRATGVNARGDGDRMESSCPKRLRLPGPRDSLPGCPSVCPSWTAEDCADPSLCLFWYGVELTGDFAIRAVLCDLIFS